MTLALRLLCGERLAAAARRLGVRVMEDELGGELVLDIVHRGADDVHQRLRLDVDAHTCVRRAGLSCGGQGGVGGAEGRSRTVLLNLLLPPFRLVVRVVHRVAQPVAPA
eukprot:scaffold80015_cov60-Phaeocystis_antarctica.AAC.2